MSCCVETSIAGYRMWLCARHRLSSIQSSGRIALPPRGRRLLPRRPLVLAIGFLLIILSSALDHNYLPLVVAATYVVAPLPNWICGRAANQDDFMDNGSSSIVELGRFMTGFMVIMGVGMQEKTDHTCTIRTDMEQRYRLCWRIRT